MLPDSTLENESDDKEDLKERKKSYVILYSSMKYDTKIDIHK